MESLESELARARDLDVADLADAVESIGFECTRCGGCCTGYEVDGEREPHTATVFPDEIRRLGERLATEAGDGDAGADRAGDEPDRGGDDVGDDRDPARADPDPDGVDDDPIGSDDPDARDAPDPSDYDWRDVARPMPFGLVDGDDGPEGETFEWALRTDACGDCTFYDDGGDGPGACTVHDDRPLICRTYPFSVALAGTSQPMGEAVDESGVVRAHECEGLGRDISRADAEELAAALKERAVRELAEAIAVRDGYEPVSPGPGEVVVHDSEGAKRPDGTPVDD